MSGLTTKSIISLLVWHINFFMPIVWKICPQEHACEISSPKVILYVSQFLNFGNLKKSYTLTTSLWDWYLNCQIKIWNTYSLIETSRSSFSWSSISCDIGDGGVIIPFDLNQGYKRSYHCEVVPLINNSLSGILFITV